MGKYDDKLFEKLKTIWKIYTLNYSCNNKIENNKIDTGDIFFKYNTPSFLTKNIRLITDLVPYFLTLFSDL